MRRATSAKSHVEVNLLTTMSVSGRIAAAVPAWCRSQTGFTVSMMTLLEAAAYVLPWSVGATCHSGALSCGGLLIVQFLLALAGDRSEYGGWLIGNAFMQLQAFGIMNITPQQPEAQEDSFVATLLGTYSAFFYHAMIGDKPRMAAYRAGIAVGARDVKETLGRPGVWIDAGCGQHLPLTRLVLETGDAEHVNAIEGNPGAFEMIDSILGANPEVAKRVTVHRGLSSEINLEKKADALIHELIGTVGSDEGLPAFVADIQDRMLAPGAAIFPHYVGSIAVPTGPPEITPLSFLCSLIFPMSEVLPDPAAPKIQNYWPPNCAWRAKETKRVEAFNYGKGSPPARDQMQQETTVSWKVDSPGLFAGVLVGVEAEVAPGCPKIDGLRQATNWGGQFIRFVKPGEEPNVVAGDEIEFTFTVDARTCVPKYTATAKLKQGKSAPREFGPCTWAGSVGRFSLI
eukprot:m.441699 g.441699  ORF g.441699 m.441699 type:complete len:457 (+) comp18695_c0_seq1:349-1719(+)